MTREAINLKSHEYDFESGNPAVYVGTYGKYNCGSIFGEWLDLSTFDSYDDFLEVCRVIHHDEKDPEFMAQDFENFPREWYTEGFMSRDEFNKIHEFAELNEYEREMVLGYLEAFNEKDAEWQKVQDKCMGEWSSEEDFAQQFADDCCMLENVPDSIKNYFDYSAFARDLFMCDYYFDGRFVWRKY